jgi:hypothetical protein
MNDNNEQMKLADYEGETNPEYVNWKSTHRIGCAEYVPDRNYIYLWVYDRPDTPYAVNLAMQTMEKWLEHIFHKNWATSEVIGDFVRCFYWIDNEKMIDIMNRGPKITE